MPVLLRHAVDSADKLVMCNDGFKPVFYSSPPRHTGDGYMIILEGQGNQQMPFCFPPDESQWDKPGVLSDCYWGPEFFPKTNAPPPAPAPNISLPCGNWQGGVHCIFSNNCTTNPAFCGHGKIVIPQCTFDNWLGDASRVLSTTYTAHYRGQRMLVSGK